MTITLITRMKQKMDMGAFGLQPNPVKSYGLGIGGGGYSGGVMDVMPHFTPPPHVMPPHAPTNPHTVTSPTSKLLRPEEGEKEEEDQQVQVQVEEEETETKEEDKEELGACMRLKTTGG